METLTELTSPLPSSLSGLIYAAAVILLCIMMYNKHISPARTPLHLSLLIWSMIIAGIILKVIIIAEEKETEAMSGRFWLSLYFIVINICLLVNYIIYSLRDPYATYLALKISVMGILHTAIAVSFAFSIFFSNYQIQIEGAGIIATFISAAFTISRARLYEMLEHFPYRLNHDDD